MLWGVRRSRDLIAIMLVMLVCVLAASQATRLERVGPNLSCSIGCVWPKAIEPFAMVFVWFLTLKRLKCQ